MGDAIEIRGVGEGGNEESTRSLAVGDVRSLIYEVRGQQVMLDSDLAMLYEVETGALNRAAKRNEARFPEGFRFQLTASELGNLKCQFGISSFAGRKYGGRRTMPYAYTEQGIAMLSGILKTEVAVRVSIGIMRAFVEMRKFIASNAVLLERIGAIELRQLDYQRSTDERFARVFGLLKPREEPEQRIFFDSQIYDAFELLIELVKRAQSDIVLIDNWVSLDTLNILAKKCEGVAVSLYTTNHGNKLSAADVEKFNAQYPALAIHVTDAFHDRFLILDGVNAYHIGASLKDAGRRCFGINAIEDEKTVKAILERLGCRPC